MGILLAQNFHPRTSNDHYNYNYIYMCVCFDYLFHHTLAKHLLKKTKKLRNSYGHKAVGFYHSPPTFGEIAALVAAP